MQYLKRHKIAAYTELLYNDKLHDYLADVNDQAEEMLFQLVKQMAKAEGVTEQLKAANQMEWIQRMNLVINRAEEIVLNEIIYN